MTFFEYTTQLKPKLLSEIQRQCYELSQTPLPNAKLFGDYLLEFTSRGKLLRGAFVFLSAESFGFRNELSINTAAGALEIAQSALLVHDDIMDNDDIRRGKASMHKIFHDQGRVSEHSGKSMALCLGDLAIFSLFSQISFSPELVTLFSRELSRTALGQAFEIEQSNFSSELSQKDILSIMEYKTARYTFVLPFMAGAIISQQDEATKIAIEKLGTIMGYLFQIRDDELNFLPFEITKKPSGGDIRENKKTLIRLKLLEEFPHLKQYFGKDYGLEVVQQHYQNSKTKQEITVLLNQYHHDASTLLRELPISTDYLIIWEDLINYLWNRVY
ncbi:MAG: polyprenyl synthetase family protein [Brevinema sp.]